MRKLGIAALAIAVVLIQPTSLSFAQDPANVTFSLSFPKSDPERYSVSVDSDGHVKYESSYKISDESDESATYESDFKISSGNRARIFALAEQAHYFSGKVDSGNRKIAFTGSKKLSYRGAGRDASAEFNYSTLPAVQQLTALFQNISATMEFRRRLEHYHRYQKLALDEEVKHMERQAMDGQLSEIQAAGPILHEIVDDSSVMSVVRVRAQRLIALGEKEEAGGK